MRQRAQVFCVTAALLLTVALQVDYAGAQGLDPIQYTFADGTVIRVSGQLNMGVLYYDDGTDSNTNFVDNENSSSRARIQYLATSGDWDFEAVFEAEYQPLSSVDVSQLNATPNWDFQQRYIRKAEVILGNKEYGKFYLGQGSMASDGTAEVDKSGTTVIAYSLISDTAGGQFFRFTGDGLSDITVGDAFTNYDGLSRKVRFRYDTPTYYGFGLRTSYGVDWTADNPQAMYDVAATYSGDFGDFAVAGAVALAHNDATDANIIDGSISTLHKPSGISLTLAAGQQDDDGPTGSYGYAKLGYERDFFDFGSTAFSVDYYFGHDIAAEDSDSRSFGVAAVQNIEEYNLSLWLLWRNHSYDDDDGEYEDGQAVFGGALFKF